MEPEGAQTPDAQCGCAALKTVDAACARHEAANAAKAVVCCMGVISCESFTWDWQLTEHHIHAVCRFIS